MAFTYRNSDNGAPLEMGFWQSLGLKGKKLDIDLDCRYSKASDAPWQDPPETFNRYQFTVKGTLCGVACILGQPAVLMVAFDMESVKNVNFERKIRNLKYTFELSPGGNIPTMPGYTMRSLEPGSGTDAPDRRRRGSYYSKQGFSGNSMEFFLEAPAEIEVQAKGTVLDYAVSGYGDGRNALLKLYPYCPSDLKTCRLGTLAGMDVDFSSPRLYPTFRFVSDETFPISLEPANPAH